MNLPREKAYEDVPNRSGIEAVLRSEVDLARQTLSRTYTELNLAIDSGAKRWQRVTLRLNRMGIVALRAAVKRLNDFTMRGKVPLHLKVDYENPKSASILVDRSLCNLETAQEAPLDLSG